MSFFISGFFGVGLLALLLSFYMISYFHYEAQAKQNVANCEKLRLRMTNSEVLEVMGQPRSSRKRNSVIAGRIVEAEVYYYSPSSESSDGVHVYFNPETGLVARVVCR